MLKLNSTRTHKILVVVVVSVVDDPVTVPLIEPAQATNMIILGVDGATALKARLSQALVQALAQTASGDLRMELAAETRVPITLEGRIGSSAVGEHVRRRAAVRIFGAAC